MYKERKNTTMERGSERKITEIKKKERNRKSRMSLTKKTFSIIQLPIYVWNDFHNFEYIMNHFSGLDVSWQPI